VAFNDTTGALSKDYATKFGISFPVAYAPRETVLGWLGLSVMQRIGVPQVAVVDRQGVVRAQTGPLGGGQLGTESYLRPYLTGLLEGKK
jgi:hypothetical protein